MCIDHQDTSEKGFQRLIARALVNDQQYKEVSPKEFDTEYCLFPSLLWAFLEETQPDARESIRERGSKAFLVRLDKQLREKGVIAMLRKGFKYYDQTITLFYPQPNSSYNPEDRDNYRANRLTVTQELIYAPTHQNRLDLVIALNGLPLLTMELKNGFTRQAVKDGIRQYKEDRSPRDKLFHTGRCMVHFAADTAQVYMTGALAGKDTTFFPFNKGQNDGSPHPPFGAGNPIPPRGGIKTAYLWEEVLQKDSVANLVEKFATLLTEEKKKKGKTVKKQIFPRYHQLMAVRKLLADAKQHGTGRRYLIQHSAGSGKSNSLTWLAHQLTGLYDQSNTVPVFDSVVVITDRKVLDTQIRRNIKAFAQVKRVVEPITGLRKDIQALNPQETSVSKTTHMHLALSNHKKIIICTVQTFPYVLQTVQETLSKKVAFLIDEAHSSQSGEAAASMNALFADTDAAALPRDEEGRIDTQDLLNHLIEGRRLLKNASYFAFTATPKNKTLEIFGEEVPYRDEHGEKHFQYLPFHTYSMKQAIEEEFILDVLQHYTTYQSYYRIKKEGSASGEEEFDTKEAHKKIRAYVEGHEMAIREKARIMIDHFRSHVHTRIRHKAKAMVVCRSIEAAMKYKEAFDTYLREINAPFRSIVAFSGKKKHWQTGEEMTEVSMNNFPDGVNDIPAQFAQPEYRFLIVANKFQTGFDQPLLHTMYVDKQLSDVQAVQTLSRLNRACKPDKTDTFVLDFYNKAEDIQEAFRPYYTTTVLSRETDPNKLHDLQEELEAEQLYDEEAVQAFFETYYDLDKDRSALDHLIDKARYAFGGELGLDAQVAFKGNAKSFVRTYSYLSKIMTFSNPGWERLWLFLKHLIPHLRIEGEPEEENILEVVDMDSYRSSRLSEAQDLVLEDQEGYVDPIPVGMGGTAATSEWDTLENIIQAFNERFGDIFKEEEGVDAQEAGAILAKEIPERAKSYEAEWQAVHNSDKYNAREASDELVKKVMLEFMLTHTAIFKKFSDDEDFKNRYQEYFFDWIRKQK